MFNSRDERGITDREKPLLGVQGWLPRERKRRSGRAAEKKKRKVAQKDSTLALIACPTDKDKKEKRLWSGEDKGEREEGPAGTNRHFW